MHLQNPHVIKSGDDKHVKTIAKEDQCLARKQRWTEHHHHCPVQYWSHTTRGQTKFPSLYFKVCNSNSFYTTRTLVHNNDKCELFFIVRAQTH